MQVRAIRTAVITAAVAAIAQSSDAAIVLNSTTYSQNFNTATSALPADWTIGGGTSSALATTLNGSSSGSAYRFQSGSDIAIGILNSGGYTTGKAIVATFQNNTGATISALDLDWNYEKYRSGSRAWTWDFKVNSTTITAGGQAYAADANNTTVTFPPTSIAKSVNATGLSIADGATFTLTWTLTGTGGSSNGQALAIDDFTLNATTLSAGNNTTITASATTVDFGKTVRGTNFASSQVVELSKTGSDTTAFSAIASGANAGNFSVTNNKGGNFGAGNVNDGDVTVGYTGSVATPGAIGTGTTIVVDNLATTSAGAGQGSNDANDVITITGGIYDLANASLAGDSDIDNGGLTDLALNADTTEQFSFNVSNVLSGLAGQTAEFTLDLLYAGAVADAGLTLIGPPTLGAATVAEDTLTFTVAIDTTGLSGAFSKTLTLSFENESANGAAGTQTITYTLEGTVVPEPASLAIVSLGGLTLMRRRRV